MLKWVPGCTVWCMVLLVSACDGGPGGYEKRDGSVVFITWDEAHGRQEHPVVEADPASFEVLENGAYAKDRSAAYFRWRKISGAHPASFVALSATHAKDAEHVFYEDSAIAAADPKSFRVIDAQWARDDKDVYLQRKAIGACDAGTFTLLERDWQRDSRCAYHRGQKLPGADPASFTVLNFWYAKDKDRVYHRAVAMEGADAATLRVDEKCDVCARDAKRCYRFGATVPCGK
jgi:hypothetical protein